MKTPDVPRIAVLFLLPFVVALVVVGWLIGVTTRTEIVTEIEGHRQRITALEEWRTAHEDTVTAPGRADIADNRRQVRTLRESVIETRIMVLELYCREMPDRCQGLPRGPGAPDPGAPRGGSIEDMEGMEGMEGMDR